MSLGTKPELQESAETKTAKEKKLQAEANWNNKGSYTSQYADLINNKSNEILNRQFDYDYNSDPVYLGLKDYYSNMGNMAQYDAQAQASAGTSGYGNSYAQTAGSSAYQQYQTELMNEIPELVSGAYSRYQDEGDLLRNQLSLLQNLEATDYEKYRDTVNDLYDDLTYYQGEYQYLNDYDFNYYKNNLDKWLEDRDYYYQQSLLDERAKEAGLTSSVSGGESVDTIAQQVIAGQWGNGQDRVNALTNAGYDYWTIQNRVNQLLGY